MAKKEHTPSHSSIELSELNPQLTEKPQHKLSESKESRETLENTDQFDSILAAQASKYGFKTPKQLIAFLRSPAGETVKDEIAQEIIEELELQRELEQEMRDKEIRRQRLMAFLLLMLLYEKNAKAHDYIERAVDEIEKMLKELKEDAESAKLNAQEPARDYEALLSPHYAALEQSKKELASLNNELDALNAQDELIDHKYGLYIDSIDAIEDELHDEHLQGRDIHALTPEEQQALHQRLDAHIKRLTSEMDEKADLVHGHLEQGDDDKARELLQESNALNLRVAAMKDLKDVLAGKKVLCDHTGQPVSSIKNEDAQFILHQDTARMLREQQKQIVQHEGQFYLIKQGQNIHEMSSEEKQEANKACKALRPEESATVKHLVQHNRGLEKRDVHHRKEMVFKRQEAHMEKILEATNAVSRIQAQRANQVVAEQTMRDSLGGPKSRATLGASTTPGGLSTTLSLSPLPSHTPHTSATPKPKPQSISDYRMAVQSFRSNPLTPDVIRRLQQEFSKVDDVQLRTLKTQLSELKPGERIPDRTIQSMLRAPTSSPQLLQSPTFIPTLNRLAAGAGKPMAEDDKRDDKRYEPTTLTPFKTTPFK